MNSTKNIDIQIIKNQENLIVQQDKNNGRTRKDREEAARYSQNDEHLQTHFDEEDEDFEEDDAQSFNN